MSNIYKITKDDDGMKLHKWMRKKFSNTPLSAIHRFLRTKKVKRNNARAKGEEVLQEGDEIRIFFVPANEKKEQAKIFVSKEFRKKNLQMLYEDEEIFVINKTFGMAVHPGSKVAKGRSIIELAQQEFPNITPRLVHRIDKETSGILLLAKHGKALRILLNDLQKGDFTKQYKALIFGKPKKENGSICLKLERNDAGQSVSHNGKTAITHYKVSQAFDDFSLVDIDIETGRTHQIRVHMAAIGCPLVGDIKYGNFGKNKKFTKKYGKKGLFLHAEKLSFPHPETKKIVKVIAPLPERWKEIIEKKKKR